MLTIINQLLLQFIIYHHLNSPSLFLQNITHNKFIDMVTPFRLKNLLFPPLGFLNHLHFLWVYIFSSFFFKQNIYFPVSYFQFLLQTLLMTYFWPLLITLLDSFQVSHKYSNRSSSGPQVVFLILKSMVNILLELVVVSCMF